MYYYLNISGDTRFRTVPTYLYLFYLYNSANFRHEIFIFIFPAKVMYMECIQVSATLPVIVNKNK